jgi:ABC-type nickel/cobalt efflux system permease component RcnA
MDNLNTNATNLANHVQDIAQTYYELARINVAQAGSKAISRAIIFFLLAGLVLCILLLVGIGLSLFLGKLLNNAATGYFIVASFYLVLVIAFYLLRKKIVFPFIRDLIVRKIYDKSDHQL